MVYQENWCLVEEGEWPGVEGAGHRVGWPGSSGTDSANTSCFSLFKELGRIEDASMFFKMILVGDKQLCPYLCVVNPT